MKTRYNGNAVTQTQRKYIVVGSIVLALIAVFTWQVVRLNRPRQYEISNATVTALNLDTRVGKIEFIHPQTAKTMSLEAYIPPECPIYIGDEQADLASVHVGDQVTVRGEIYPDQTKKALWIRVTRRAADSQPATAPDAGTD